MATNISNVITTGGSFLISANLQNLVKGGDLDIPVSSAVLAELIDPSGTNSGVITLLSSTPGADWTQGLVVGEFTGTNTSLLTPGRRIDLQISVADGTTVDPVFYNWAGLYSVVQGHAL